MTVRIPIHSWVGIIVLIVLGLIHFAVAAPPAPAQGFSLAFDDMEFMVSPGERLTATFKVTNVSEEQKVLRIYAGDWVRVPLNIPEGRSRYVFDAEGGNETRSFLDWLRFSPERMELEPWEAREVYCEVNFPDDPTLEGSYWGVIFVEDAPSSEELDLEAPSEGGMAVGITTVFRVAVKIYATFENTEIREASLVDLQFERAEGGFDVVAVIENLGNIHMRPRVWLELRNAAGEVVYEQDHVRQTLLPESARDYLFELRNLSVEPGAYLVMVIVDYGVPALIAGQGRIQITSEQAGSVSEEEEAGVE